MVNTSQSTSQCSRWLPPSHSWHLTLSGLVLNVQSLGELQALFLISFSSIVLFFCVSLGPWRFLLRLATSHPSMLARARIFLRSTNDTTSRSMFRRPWPSFTHYNVLRRTAGAQAPHTPFPRAARAGRCLQSSTALVVVLQNDFTSFDFTNTAHQLNTRQVAHHTFDPGQQCSFSVGSHQDSLVPQ